MRPAPHLREQIPLLHEAAARLSARGLGPVERVRRLRGLYYGTRHSLDYERRGSALRNLGFNLYLQSLPPSDPTPLLGAGLVRALKDSAVVQHEGRHVDLGHCIIGLEARSRPSARLLPLWSQGGTGLELSTWLGDLGGAAGLLALQRLEDPAARARALLFDPQGYDLRPNLEGDLAGYLLARDPAAGARISALPRRGFTSVARALEDYTGRGPGPSDWAQRYRLFAPMLGARLHQGALADREALLRRFRAQTEAFTACYILYRLRHLGRASSAALLQASRHVAGAAAELSELFLAVLEQGLGGPGATGPLPDLDPSPLGPPHRLLRALARGQGWLTGLGLAPGP